MVELKAVTAATKGRAKWVGVELPEKCSEAEAKQRIFNAPLNGRARKLAERIGLEVGGLSFGAVWPELKKHRDEIEKDLIENAGWEPKTLISWDDTFYLIQLIWFNKAVGRYKVRLQAFGPPVLHEARFPKQKTARPQGILMPLSKKTRTVYPIDLIDAIVREVGSLSFY